MILCVSGCMSYWKSMARTRARLGLWTNRLIRRWDGSA